MAPWIRIPDHEVEQSKYRQKHLFPPLIPVFCLHSVEMHLIHFFYYYLKPQQSRESRGKRKGIGGRNLFFSTNHRADAFLLNVKLSNRRCECLSLLTYMRPEER